MNIIKLSFVSVTIATLLIAVPASRAQQGKEPPPAPVPAQIFTGKKVFVSNAGGDSNGLYSGDANRLYNHFYSSMKGWGRYELADSPATVDLVLEIAFVNPFVGEDVSGGNNLSVSSHPVSDPQFRLIILDPTTRVILWVFTEHIERALLQGNRDKNFDRALASIVNDLRNVAGQPAATAANAKN